MTDLNEYEMYVHSKLSNESKSFDALIESMQNLKEAGDLVGVKIPELVTASHGLAAEAGEFAEIVKKMLYQGKPLNDDNRFHLQRELGDIFFYTMVACAALGITADEAIRMNKEKLDARYKEGFTVEESENRAGDDV